MFKFVKALKAGLCGRRPAQALAEKVVRETKATVTAQIFRPPPAASTTTKQWGWNEIDTLGNLKADFSDLDNPAFDLDMCDNFDNFDTDFDNLDNLDNVGNGYDSNDDFGIFYNDYGFGYDTSTTDNYPETDTDESTSGTSSSDNDDSTSGTSSTDTGDSTSGMSSSDNSGGSEASVPVTLANNIGAVRAAFDGWGLEFPKPQLKMFAPEPVDEFECLFVERSAHWEMDNIDSGDEGSDEYDDQVSYSCPIPTQPLDDNMVTRDLGLGLWGVPSV
ncbi:hypothetical protein Q8F55_000385 [Vanrija albida]|uniref:AGC-kinase C-terminal domain-containing protein n=1 Tax=Vanrija albida TaxID=181172 RepID=A0ABR3QE21_9TREE